MKRETKHLIELIKALLLREKASHIYADEKTVDTDWDSAVRFLDSLPEIESKLCQGGYIKDENGTPCCHGDKIIVDMFGKKVYTLEWNPKQRCFCFVRPFDNGYKSMHTLGENFFTKVE
jgi:hypothetical protein